MKVLLFTVFVAVMGCGSAEKFDDKGSEIRKTVNKTSENFRKCLEILSVEVQKVDSVHFKNDIFHKKISPLKLGEDFAQFDSAYFQIDSLKKMPSKLGMELPIFYGGSNCEIYLDKVFEISESEFLIEFYSNFGVSAASVKQLFYYNEFTGEIRSLPIVYYSVGDMGFGILVESKLIVENNELSFRRTIKGQLEEKTGDLIEEFTVLLVAK